MNHSEWIGKTLGEFIDHVNSRHSYAIGYYDINRNIGLEEVIGLCIYDRERFLDKYYNKVIYRIDSNGDSSYSMYIR